MKRRACRALVTAAFAAALVVGASSCGFDDQTLQPYTQAEGVNVDSQTDQTTDMPLVKVRNMMVISKADGEGFLSGALYAYEEDDKLVAVQVAPVKADGTTGTPYTVEFGGSLTVPAEGVAQLNGDAGAITVTGDTLKMGHTVQITLSFENAGDVVAKAPIVDGNKADYETVSPAN